MRHLTLIKGLLALLTAQKASARCDEPSPAFPPLDYTRLGSDQQAQLDSTFASIGLKAEHLAKKYPTTSFSLEVTSSLETLWEHHHTAVIRNDSRPDLDSNSKGATVSGHTVYRVASITKVFTVLAILREQLAGKLELDDPIVDYVPELLDSQVGTGPGDAGFVRWENVRLRALGSQLSGIPRECEFGFILLPLLDSFCGGFFVI